MARILDGTDEADADYISSEISRLAEGVRFQRKTVTRAIERYVDLLLNGMIRGPPFKEVRAGPYHLVKKGDWRIESIDRGIDAKEK